jgi:DNA uptake protein ComE-like DNA-binding protein
MRKDKRMSESFITGVIALVFLIVGYQTALFIRSAAVARIAANRDEPDTVFIYGSRMSDPGIPDHEGSREDRQVVRKNSRHDAVAEAVRSNTPARKVESFRFNPNTVTVEDLCRLGFTPKQALSIDNYRIKGGRFRRKEDFRKSYVVSDSIFRRLEKYIDIPLVDLNLADSAAFDSLPGIGGWFADKILEHRAALGGYSYKEQLMDIYRFDREKYEGLCDLVTVAPENVTPYRIWSLPADSLRLHPYIKDYETARSIVLFRENTPREEWTVDALLKAGVIDNEKAVKLSRCALR